MDSSRITILFLALVLLQIGLIVNGEEDIAPNKDERCVQKCGTSGNVNCKIGDDVAECTCQDTEKKFDSNIKDCRSVCAGNDTCKHSSKCEKEKDGDMFCNCLPGTSGDVCDIVDDCEFGKYKNCTGGEKGECSYDVNEKKAKCTCKDNRKLSDKSGYCKGVCTDDTTCKHGSKCEKEEENGEDKFCNCFPGTSGDACDIVDDCALGKYKNCTGGEKGECRYDVEEKKAKCTCKDNRKLLDVSGYCEVCDCGESSTGCDFKEDKKVCKCKDTYSYSEKRGVCEQCLCGNNTEPCNFNKEGEKICNCKDKFALKDGKCEVSDETCDKEKEKCRETKGNCIANKVGNITCQCPDENIYLKDEGCVDPKVDCPDKIQNCKETKGVCVKNEENKIRCVCPSKLDYETAKGCIVLNKTCKEERSQCLETNGICIANEEGKINCKCQENEKGYLVGKGCLDLTESCKKDKEQCLETQGTCVANEGLLSCVCKEEGKAYLAGKGCADLKTECLTAAPKCTETKGICRTSDEDKIECLCKPKMEYDKDQGCAVLNATCQKEHPKCLEKGFCDVNAKNETFCKCFAAINDYVSERGCIVNKCKSKCGNMISNLVVCDGDKFGEADVTCRCKDEKMDFLHDKKICKHVKALSAGGIAGIIIVVIAGFALVLAFFIYRKKRAADNNYRASFRGETITFESALYNATYDSMESRNSQ